MEQQLTMVGPYSPSKILITRGRQRVMPFRNGNYPANKKMLDEQQILDLYAAGESSNKIGQRLGCNKATIVKVLKKHGVLRFRRLTPEEQAQAVSLYQKGLSAPVIAKELRVCPPAIYL